MASGKECRIIVTGAHYPITDNEGSVGPKAKHTDPIVTVQEVRAEYFRRGDSLYLFYEEQPEGCLRPFKTRVKLKGDILEINRQGSDEFIGNRMVFEPGIRYSTEYATPLGILILDIVTKSVKVGENVRNADSDDIGINGAGVVDYKTEDEWPDVSVSYILENQGESLGEYKLTICKQ